MNAQINDEVDELTDPSLSMPSQGALAAHIRTASAEYISAAELSPQARAAYPDVSVLVTRLAVDPSWQRAASPDWSALRPASVGLRSSNRSNGEAATF